MAERGSAVFRSFGNWNDEDWKKNRASGRTEDSATSSEHGVGPPEDYLEEDMEVAMEKDWAGDQSWGGSAHGRFS